MKTSLKDFQCKRVEWDALRVGDIIWGNGGFKEIIAITDGYGGDKDGKTLNFVTTPPESCYKVRNRNGELDQYLRVLRVEEGGQPIPESDLVSHDQLGTDAEVLKSYRQTKRHRLDEIETPKNKLKNYNEIW